MFVQPTYDGLVSGQQQRNTLCAYLCRCRLALLPLPLLLLEMFGCQHASACAELLGVGGNGVHHTCYLGQGVLGQQFLGRRILGQRMRQHVGHHGVGLQGVGHEQAGGGGQQNVSGARIAARAAGRALSFVHVSVWGQAHQLAICLSSPARTLSVQGADMVLL